MGSTSQPVVTVLRKFSMQRQERRLGVFTLAWDNGGPPY